MLNTMKAAGFALALLLATANAETISIDSVSGLDRETHYRGLSQYGKQYALYIHHSEGGGGSTYTVTPGRYRETLVLNLPPGDYKAQWIDPTSYSILATDPFKHSGGTRNLITPTYSIDIALRIIRQ